MAKKDTAAVALADSYATKAAKGRVRVLLLLIFANSHL